MTTHAFATRVWYEDTDMGGIVYYANYLKFIERARSAMIEGAGIDQNALRDRGLVFAVRRIEADYIAPARYGDALIVTTTAISATGARAVLKQDVAREDSTLFSALVTLVALGAQGRPARLPAELRRLLAP